MMTTYETTATVENQGQIRVSGIPFEPGTRVDVTITPMRNGAGGESRMPVEGHRQEPLTSPDDERLRAARDRMRELFRTVTGFRMAPRIPREELYERGHLR